MGDVQLSSAVSAVVSAFHSAVENVQNIRKKSNRFIKNEKTIKEKLLQDTLETAEHQISQRYSQHFRDVGDQFAIGDDVARDRLFRIAILMQSDLVRSLQIAMQVDDANLNLTKLQEDALMSKRDTLDALDSLRDRLLRQFGVQSPSPSHLHPLLRRPSSESVGTHISSHTMSSNNSGIAPGGVMLSDDSEGRGGVSRLLSARRSLNRYSGPSDPSRITDLTSMDWPGAAPIHPAFRQTSPEPSPRADEPVSPGGAQRSPGSGRDNVTSMLSDWSDKIVVVHEPQMTPPAPASAPPQQHAFPPAPTSFPSVPPSWTQAPNSPPIPAPVQQQRQSYVQAQAPPRTAPAPPSPGSSHRSGSSSFSFAHTSSPGPASPGPSHGPIVPDNSSAIHEQHQTQHHSRFSSFRHKPSSASSLALPTGSMLGRPDKHNNYWGFCKSAWTIREDPKKGLSTFDKPDGFTIYRKVWLCKTCAFDGEVFGAKKPYTFDPNIYTASNGIRYKWIFLAKSHAKKKAMEAACYGCVFCVAEGKSTGIFGDIETLIGHIASEHGSGVREDVREKCRAVFGRLAGAGEDWDINIPVVTTR